ncbi:MAG TPA: PIN domain-containing protein [Thermoplasmata archaeon]|nr:PIN domain-containing protein [Thermoplasmata archaeon]
MRGVDTPLLLALLEGRPDGRGIAEHQPSEELCTTEINMFELEALARMGPSDGRARRLAALERLRRRLGILPIDERAARLAALLAAQSPGALPASTCLVVGAFQAAGATEMLTTEASHLSGVKLPIRVTIVQRRHPKSR